MGFGLRIQILLLSLQDFLIFNDVMAEVSLELLLPFPTDSRDKFLIGDPNKRFERYTFPSEQLKPTFGLVGLHCLIHIVILHNILRSLGVFDIELLSHFFCRLIDSLVDLLLLEAMDDSAFGLLAVPHQIQFLQILQIEVFHFQDGLGVSVIDVVVERLHCRLEFRVLHYFGVFFIGLLWG